MASWTWTFILGLGASWENWGERTTCIFPNGPAHVFETSIFFGAREPVFSFCQIFPVRVMVRFLHVSVSKLVHNIHRCGQFFQSPKLFLKLHTFKLQLRRTMTDKAATGVLAQD